MRGRRRRTRGSYVDRGHAAIEVSRGRQREKLANPDGEPNLDEQPPERAGPASHRVRHEAQACMRQLHGRERAALEHHPAEEHGGERDAQDGEPRPRRVQELRHGPQAVLRPAREDAPVGGPALHDPPPAARVPLLHEIRDAGTREVHVLARPLVVPVKARNVGAHAVHERRLEGGRVRGQPDGERAHPEPPRRHQPREPWHAPRGHRALQHLAGEPVDLDDEKAAGTPVCRLAQPCPAGEPVQRPLHAQDHAVEGHRLAIVSRSLLGSGH